jgi:demethylmenaquinone methyltransferase/2-methoxy-6-polyprenyl-1,4-benzoquinol methylase
MFSRIAPHYDLMNWLMTFGQDKHWRIEVVKLAAISANNCWLLDLGAGTGDLGTEALRQNPDCNVIAADFTFNMIIVGKKKQLTHPLRWITANALQVPFEENTFDAVISGFLLRNVSDLPKCLTEIYRLLRPGCRMVALDTTRPAANWHSPFLKFYLHKVIPSLGTLIAGESDAYRYLPDSTEGFLEARQLADEMCLAGFQEVGYKRFMLGTIAIHWGTKAPISSEAR